MKITLAVLALTAAHLPAVASPPSSDYQSTTAAYIPYRDDGIADWRAANAEMARLHGHMGHLGTGKDQPMEHEIHPAQPAPGGMEGHRHPMGGQP